MHIGKNMSVFANNYTLWAIVDGLLLVTIVLGNVLTVVAITLNRRLRNITSNYFVLSLALSDLSVGLALAYHLGFYVNRFLSEVELLCILRFVVLNLACGGSMCNLIAIAIDRYVAIVHPLKYGMFATRKYVLLMIFVGWIYNISVATIPMYWNCYDSASTCEIETVLPRYYIAAILTPTFILIWLSMFLLYWQIWKEANTHVRRLQHTGCQELRKRDWKNVQVVLLVLGCFSICWFPYLIVACTRAFDWNKKSTPTLYKTTFSLAMANSGMNPIIYAWKNTKFRKTFQRLLRFQLPSNEFNSSLKAYLHKQNELRKRNVHVQNNTAMGVATLQTFCYNHNFNDIHRLEVTNL